MTSPYRLAIDVGGTFTDFVMVAEDGRVVEAKTPSTPTEPGEAMYRGLTELAAGNFRELTAFLADCSLMIIGSTVALNALLQHRGAKTGLICTRGFRDTLEMRLGYRDVRQDLRDLPPPLLVRRQLRVPVSERIDKAGRIAIPLDEPGVRQAIEVFRQERIESVAVCLLWSFVNPTHERRISAILTEEMPEVYQSLSVDVAPQIREYDRTSTTVLNAYVGPRLSEYVRETEESLRKLGFRGEIRYTQSNGGFAGRESLESRAVLAINSGPAAAPAAGLFFGRNLGFESVITADMGGTSFDACLIDRGVPDVRSSTDIHRYRVAAPMVNINTIGSGGGSIAWIDHGILRVGPQSAEVSPGPACYMRGGADATVTDADVALGYLNQEALLGGKFEIDPSLARSAVKERIAVPLGLSTGEAALGIYEIVNRNMATAISQISLERGFDPRQFSLIAAGGQGALHAAELARQLGIPRVIVPRFASTFCAFGALASDLRHDYKRSFTVRLVDADIAVLEGLFREMEHEGYRELELEGCDPADVTSARKLDMRYAGQIFDVAVDVSGVALNSGRAAAEIAELLHAHHEKEYTYRIHDGVPEIMNAALTVVGRMPEIRLPQQDLDSADATEAARDPRKMLFRGFRRFELVSVYDGTALRPGNVVPAPAVVEETNTTILVPPGFKLEVTSANAYFLEQAA